MRKQTGVLGYMDAFRKMNKNFGKALTSSFGKMGSKRKPRVIKKTKSRWVPR